MRQAALLVSAALCLFTSPRAHPQTLMSTTSVRADAQSFTITVDRSREVRTPVVAGAPYSGRQTSKSVQTLADGTKITRQTQHPMTYRDSAGRVCTEWQAFPVTGSGKPVADFTLVEIVDVVAGHCYLLDSMNRVAHRYSRQVRQEPARPASIPVMQPTVVSSESRMSDGRIVKTEFLGTQIISGVLAVGRRTVVTHPAGSILGNDRPVTTVSEAWNAPDLQLTLLSRNSSLNMETTAEWENFRAAEPDPALFQVPADYRVVDETGPFKIVIPRSRPPVSVGR